MFVSTVKTCFYQNKEGWVRHNENKEKEENYLIDPVGYTTIFVTILSCRNGVRTRIVLTKIKEL